MSERGSMVTEYISCAACLAAVREVLCGEGEPLPSDLIRAYQIAGDVPVVAARTKYPAPVLMFEELAGDDLVTRLCHPLRVAVLAEDGASAVFLIRPGVGVEELTEGRRG